MRISKSITVVLSVLVWILGLLAMNAFASTPGVSHPAAEILGDDTGLTSDATFPSRYYFFDENLEAFQQITAGTKFYVGGAEFTSAGIGQTGASNFAIKTSNTDRVTVTSTGNVGIGTTTPDQKLHIVDTPVANKHYPGNVDITSVIEGTNAALQIIGKDESGVMSHLILTGAPVSGDNKHWIISHIGPIGNNRFSIAYQTSGGSGWTPPNTFNPADEKFVITIGGNVGIGTVSPSYQLSLGDTSGNQAGFLMSPTAPPGLGGFLALYGSGRTPGVDKPNLVIAPQSYSTCPGCIGVNKTQPVGGASPISTTLDVEGTVTATAFLGDGSGLTGIGSGTGGVINTGSTTIGADSDSDGVGQIDLQTRGNTRMMIKSDGRMGIVPDPARAFNDPTRTLCIGSQTTCIDNGYNPAVGSPVWPTDLQLDTLAFLTNNSERMRITSTGLIGIGTSSPTTNLHLRSTGSLGLLLEADTDNITETDQPVITFSQDGGTVTGQLGYLNGTNALTLKNIYNDTLYLGTNNTNRITILGNGNVGIGMSPTYRLDVSGDIRASGTIYGTLVGTASNLECSPAGCVGTNDIADGAVTNAKISAMDWVKLQNYPATCPAGQAISQLGDTITCITVNPTGTLTGSGSANTVAKFTGTYALGDSIISDNGSSVSIGGNLTVSGVGTFNDLTVSGTGSFTNPVTVGAPTLATHAATKGYVDTAIGGGTAANALACNADGTCETNDISATGNITATGVGTFNGAGNNYFAGNVGIGVVPTSKLDVAGSIYSTGQVTSSTLLVSGNVQFSNLLTCSAIRTDGSGNLQCVANNVTGSGTNGRIAKFTGGTSLGDSIINESAGNLFISGNIFVSGGMQLDSGVRLNATGGAGKPACGATQRGTLWFTQGAAAGDKDTLEVCAKDATDTYAWRLLW